MSEQRGSDGLTAEAVRGVVFGKPPLGKAGYDEDEVDAFLDRAAAALDAVAAGTVPGLTFGEVMAVSFRHGSFGRRGYDQEQVDDLLDQLAVTLGERESAGHGAVPPRPSTPTGPGSTPGLVESPRKGFWGWLRG